MKNIRLRDVEGYEEFKAECDFFRCEEEYPGWTGTKKYIIVSNLSEEDLSAKYPLVIAAMRPFMIVGEEIGKIRTDSNNAERRAARFSVKHETIFNFDEDTECCNEELVDWSSYNQMAISMEMEEALSCLTEVQRNRIKKYYFDGYTIKEIAIEENVQCNAVRDSIDQALKKLKKYFA